MWVRAQSNTLVVGVLTHFDNDSCTTRVSRFRKIFEDGRVACALEHGDAYYPDGDSGCDDSGRPAYSRGQPPLPSLGVIDVTWLLLLVVGVALSMAPNLPTTQGEIKHESYRPILRIWDRLFNAKMYGKSIPECDPIARLGFKGLVFSDLQSLKQY